MRWTWDANHRCSGVSRVDRGCRSGRRSRTAAQRDHRAGPLSLQYGSPKRRVGPLDARSRPVLLDPRKAPSRRSSNLVQSLVQVTHDVAQQEEPLDPGGGGARGRGSAAIRRPKVLVHQAPERVFHLGEESLVVRTVVELRGEDLECEVKLRRPIHQERELALTHVGPEVHGTVPQVPLTAQFAEQSRVPVSEVHRVTVLAPEEHGVVRLLEEPRSGRPCKSAVESLQPSTKRDLPVDENARASGREPQQTLGRLAAAHGARLPTPRRGPDE
jgi:hypothetical protein